MAVDMSNAHFVCQNLIFEYLNSVGLMQQAHTLVNDFKTIQNNDKPTSLENGELQQKLLEYYENGERKNFFELWKENVTVDVMKHKFYISLYFCIYPLLNAIKLVSCSKSYSKSEIAKWYK